MDVISPPTKLIHTYIVEDYHLTRMGLISALMEFPHIHFVGESDCAEDALVQLSSTHVDVLILDLGLPDMNGIEMAQEVRQRWPGVRIIILTSHNQPEEVIAALGAGAQAYALKDIKPYRLVQVIETVYEGAAWLDPAIAQVVLASLINPSEKSPSSLGVSSPIGSGKPVSVTDLTEREREVLQLIVQGKNNQDISETLHISIHTTKAHVGNILSKLCVDDRVQAAIKALKENIV